jgi:tetratricopeptide (TPR) repeat protein
MHARWAVCCVLMAGCSRVAPRTSAPEEPAAATRAVAEPIVVPEPPPRPSARSEAELQAALGLDLHDASAYEGLARLYHERSLTRPSYAILAQQVITQGMAMLARDGRVSADLLTTRGLLALDQGRPDRARQDLLAAVEVDPGDLRAQTALGLIALQLHDESRARDILRIVVATPQGRQDARAWRGLGLAELRLGDLPAAQEAYRRAAAAAPTDPRIQYDLALLADLSADASTKIPSDAESQAHYRRFVALAGDDPRFAVERERALDRIANPKYWSCTYPIGTLWGTAQEHQDFEDGHARAHAMQKEQEAFWAAQRASLLELERKALAAEAAEAAAAQ